MHYARIISCVGLMFLLLECPGQAPLISLGPWHLEDLSGGLDLRGQFRQLESDFNDIIEDQRSTYLLGGIKLNTGSYLWDPDVLSIDLGGVYSPETRDEKYITVPDRSEMRTLKKLNFTTTFCNNRPVTLQGFLDYHKNYYNRELLTNVSSNNLQWGGRLLLNNRLLPATLSYRKVNWEQEEIQSGRIFSMDQYNIEARASKSFGDRDRSELVYSHNDYLYRYADVHQTIQQIDRIALNNNVYFDGARNYSLNSRVNLYNQEGTTPFRRIEVLEGISMVLPHHFRLTADLDLYNLKDPRQQWDQKRGRTSLQHKLFESLASRVSYEMGQVRLETEIPHSESDRRGEIDISYTKKIPTGSLNLNYRYNRHHHSAEGESGFIQVFNEAVMLTDGEITLLKKPYVESSSVVVKDLTGALIYQLNFDYLLVRRGSFTEIQRIPGGQITEGATVYADYTYNQPGAYSYTANHHRFNASIMFLNRLIGLYYTYAIQDYPRVEQGDLLTLNHFRQHIYGIRLDAGFARAGVEADLYDSDIIPYRLRRYYLDMNWNLRSKVILNLNGNIRDYRMIADLEDQLYSNLSAKVVYRHNPRIRLSLESGYLNQKGANIDLNLLTTRVVFLSVLNKLQIRTGVEMYRRLYLNSEFIFNGAFIQLSRRF